MKTAVKMAIVAVAFTLVGAGCGGSSSSAPAAPAAAKAGKDVVSAKLTAGGFTSVLKDKTANVQQQMSDIGDAVTAATEFKLNGSSVIVSVADVKDGRNGIVQAKLYAQIIAAKAAGYEGKIVLSVNPTSVVAMLWKTADAAVSVKVEDALRK